MSTLSYFFKGTYFKLCLARQIRDQVIIAMYKYKSVFMDLTAGINVLKDILESKACSWPRALIIIFFEFFFVKL
jgi:hypothetical protein